jgi:transposase InsO family protein
VIARYRAEYPVTLMCRVLEVARSAFYAWQHRRPSRRAQHDVQLRVALTATHRRSHATYGTPRHQRTLRAQQQAVSRRRIGRLMRESGLVAVAPRAWRVTTQTDPRLPVALNHLDRQFTVAAPNQVWAADLTYCHTQEGWLYLAVVLDLCSRRVVGWATGPTLDGRLVQTALARALALRQPAPGLLHHSDRGSQYAGGAYQQQLAAHGIAGSMSRTGNCWDNAVVESFFSTLKRELVHRQTWATRGTLTRKLADYIHDWYNRERRHSTLGYVSPLEFETRLRSAA